MKKKLYLILPFLFMTNLIAQDNPHGGDFKLPCATCHTSNTWNEISTYKFNHDQTSFALQGAHKKVECLFCHTTLTFNDTRKQCFECHTDFHKNELGNDCQNCHTEQGWNDPALFVQFHNQTAFPLTGVHAIIDCESCHVTEQQRQYANTPVYCSDCHLDIFMTTLNPDHQKAGFDLQCQNCHATFSKGWQQTVFAHNNNFPLKEGHGGLDCQDCHGADYNIKSVVCFECHQEEYNTASNPNHAAFAFPVDCEQCHTGISWERSVFNHLAESGFAVEGRHKDILCTECHVNNQLNGLSLECIGCHKQEYNAANDPNHIAANFPASCENCHSDKAWEPAKWDHDKDYFPIYSGEHREEWNACSDCHVYAGNYAQFECITCHEHRQSEMDDEHRGRRNYVYESQACFDCHPRGRE